VNLLGNDTSRRDAGSLGPDGTVARTACGTVGHGAPGTSEADDALGRNETPLERCDRNLVELLQEVRVVQTGVQVLFAFLLTIPFSARFADVTDFQTAVYFGTLLVTAAAAVLLIAPTSWHRILFRRGDKEHLVLVANAFALAGLGCVAVSMTGVVLLVSDVLFGSLAMVTAATAAGVVCAYVWFVLPVQRRRRLGDLEGGLPAADDTGALADAPARR
jgi:hypothetical protein